MHPRFLNRPDRDRVACPDQGAGLVGGQPDLIARLAAAYPPVPVELPWKTPEGRPATARLLVTTPQGRAVHRSAFNVSRWQPALKAAGIPAGRENGQHALRHYDASALLARGVDIRALSEYLGHHDPGFTLRTYVHLMPDADDRARQAVDAAFASSDGPATAQGGHDDRSSRSDAIL